MASPTALFILALLCQEPNPFRLGSEQARHAADVASTATVGVAIAANTLSCGLQNDAKSGRWRCWAREACSVGLATGVMLAAKALVPRTRPDGSDRRSFFSGHSAQAGAAQGWNLTVGWTLAASTGLERMMADKHFPSDVAVGLLDGWGSVAACNRLIPHAPGVEKRRPTVFGPGGAK